MGVAKADIVTQEEASAVIRLVETLRATRDGMQIGEFAKSLNLPEDYVRELIGVVREPELARVRPEPKIGFIRKLWHLTIGLSAFFACWAGAQLVLNPRSELQFRDFEMLFLYSLWVGLTAFYYRHVLGSLLRRFADGFRP